MLLFTNLYTQVEKLLHLPSDERVFQLWKKVYVENGEYNQLMTYLDSVKTISKSRHDYRLYWYADFHQYFKTALKEAKPENWYKQAEAYAARCPEPVVKAACWFSFGNVLFKNQRFEEANKLLYRARNEFERIEYERIPEASVYLFQSMEQYYYFEDYPTAIQYGLLAEQLNQVNSGQIIHGLNILGMAYQRQKEYAKAKEAFMKVMSLAEEHVNAEYLGIATGNYGNILRLEGKNREALPFLYTDYEINNQIVPENTAMTCLHISEALLALDSVVKAKNFLDCALYLNPKKVGDNYALNYFETQTLYYKKVKNHQLAALYLDSTLIQKDSLRKAVNAKIQTAYQSEISAKKYLAGIQSNEIEAANAVWMKAITVGSLFLLTLTGLYAANQKRQKRQIERELEEERKRRAAIQLEHYLNSIQDKINWVDKISNQLKETNLPSHYVSIHQQEINNQLYALLSSVVLTEKDWGHFKPFFEGVYPDFVQNLKAKTPDLSPLDIRLLSLFKLNLKTKEIAYMMGMTVEAIRKSRHRLRQKIDSLQAETDLQELLEEV